MAFSFEKKLILIFSILIIEVVVAGVITYKINKTQEDTEHLIQHTHEALYASEQVFSSVQDIVLGTRGYVITVDSVFLRPFEKANKRIHKEINLLENLVKDNPAQKLRTDTLENLIDARIKLSFQTIQLRKEKGFGAAQQLITSNRGKFYMDKIRNLIQTIEQEEEGLLLRQQEANAKSSAAFNRSFFTLLGSVLLILIIVYFIIRHNIYVRKRAEIKLQNSIKEIADYKCALHESAIVAITDQKGIIKHTNDNFCKISKYSRDELIGQDHRIINSGYHPKEFIRDLWVTIANGKIWKGELKNKAKDGTVYWVDTNIIPFLNEEGKPYQYLAIRVDITDRKKGEEQLLAVNKELEAFSYSVSHDLRAPLRAVHGYSKMLSDDYGSKLDTEATRLINNIMSNAKQMGQLIDALLVFSRLGRKELVKNNIRMHDRVHEIFAEFKKEEEHRNIELHMGELFPAYADNITIKQVWMNLISNAIKYTRHKEKAIIEIGFEEKGNEIIYYVKDNGAGFDMSYADKLFGVFQRLHSDEEFEGTGVGLAIVHRIIVKHGGRIWAEGKVNEGAVFSFSLPKN